MYGIAKLIIPYRTEAIKLPPIPSINTAFHDLSFSQAAKSFCSKFSALSNAGMKHS